MANKKTTAPAANADPAVTPPTLPATPASGSAPVRPARVKKKPAPPATKAPATMSPPSPARRTGKIARAVIGPAPTATAKNPPKPVEYQTDPETGRPLLPPDYKPDADEDYMNPLQLEYFRQRLLQWREELVEESKQTIENLKDEVRDVGDDAERATRETENSLELRTRDRYRKLIGKIDSTLKRVDSGDYGYSIDSGDEIGLDRLEARLTAERTLDEQERWEHRQRQMGD